MEDDIVRGQDDLDPRPYRTPSRTGGRESTGPKAEAGAEEAEQADEESRTPAESRHDDDDDGLDDEVEDGEDELVPRAMPYAAVAAADDVADLLVLDVDDDDLGDDLDTLASAKSSWDEDSLEKLASGMRPRDSQGGTGTASAPGHDSPAPSRPPEYYKGLVKRLEPFAELVVSVDPRDPDGQSQIRERLTAIERFRADLVEQAAAPLVDKDSGTLFCRICRDTEGHALSLVAPCRCRGSVARVHVGCLERWLAESDSTCCELCGHQYTTIRTPSYNVLASIPAWIIKDGNADLLFDFVAFLIFTPVALLGTHLGLSANDSAYFQVSLMAAIDLVYSAWLAMRVHYHAMRWYSWWRRKCSVKVVLDSEERNDNKVTDLS